MATKRIKQVEAEVEEEDRLSALPDSIILHIFSFIPTHILVRMSVFSKRWRHLWLSGSALYAIEDSAPQCVGFKRRDNFLKFVKQYLNLHSKEITHRFKLVMSYHKSSKELDCWLKKIMCQNKFIKEIDICLYRVRKTSYCLTEKLLNSRSLTVLKLKNLDLMAFSPVGLPSLKACSLINVAIKDNRTLSNLFLGCFSIENLVLSRCRFSCPTSFSNSNLKSLEIDDFWGSGAKIQLEAANLESFVFNGGHFWDIGCVIDISASRRLRNLSVSYAGINDQWFESLFANHIELERLKLDMCFGLKNMCIESEKLKEFVLCGYGFRFNEAEQSATINTPNLVSFVFEGYKTISDFSIKAPNLIEPRIKLITSFISNDIDYWYAKLIKFLRHFDGFERLSLEVTGEVCMYV